MNITTNRKPLGQPNSYLRASARSPRDHWTEQPAPWIGGVCDKGIVHTANEDAMALAATPDGTLSILVVCDGIAILVYVVGIADFRCLGVNAYVAIIAIVVIGYVGARSIAKQYPRR